MNAALWLLLALQFKGWARYFLRSLRTVKGVFLALIGGAMFGFWAALMLSVPARGLALDTDPEEVRNNILAAGPALLLCYSLLNVLFSSGEKGIYFSPAEVNFLFSGPFTRREILAYKIMTTVLLVLPSSLFLAVMFRGYAPSFLSVCVGLFLIVLFISMMQQALNLIGVWLGASLYTRLRKVALTVGVLALVWFAVASGLLQPEQWQTEVVLRRLKESAVWYYAAWPLRTFFEVFLSERVWPDLVYWSGLAALVDLALVGVIFWLDANYLETSAVASARTYARIQRLRSGNVWAGDEGGGGKVRLRLPLLPYWGGIGPILWRQLTAALRGMGRLMTLLVIFGIFLGMPLFGAISGNEGGTALLSVAAGFTVWLTVILSSVIPFDFRGDIDRMAVLKSLPIAPWRLTIGQLLTPTLLVSFLQWLVLGLILGMGLTGVGLPGPDEQRVVVASALVGAAFVFPFNFLLFGLENLLFLLFPSRVMGNQPGDFQAVGRNILFVFAKILSLMVVVGVASAVAVLVSLLARSLVLGLAGAWLVLAGSAALTVPLVALAFSRFDVGRDTPP